MAHGVDAEIELLDNDLEVAATLDGNIKLEGLKDDVIALQEYITKILRERSSTANNGKLLFDYILH